MKKNQLTVNQIIRAVESLTDEDLSQLKNVIEAIQDARSIEPSTPSEDKNEQSPQHATPHGEKIGRRGYYELKEIRGHHYWYLRWHEGGHYRSLYIGKNRGGCYAL